MDHIRRFNIAQPDDHDIFVIPGPSFRIDRFAHTPKEFKATKIVFFDFLLIEPRGNQRFHDDHCQTESDSRNEEKDWQKAEQYLEDVSDALKLHATRREGEAALYGPKLDYMFKDSLGREFQLATIQLDFAMPKRFGLAYIGKDGKEETPIMIHRAILGSYERFLAILLEHFNGALPTWLAPVQAAILPVGEKFVSYARTVAEKLKEAGVRVELPGADETLGSRIRKAEMQRVPYIVVVGDKEEKAGTINVRPRGGEPSETTVQEFITTFSQ